jgi:hypothetical protein
VKNNNCTELRNNLALIPQVCSYLEMQYPVKLDHGEISL